MNFDTAIKEGQIYCILVSLYIVNNNNDKNLAVANKDAGSGAEAYMSLSLA